MDYNEEKIPFINISKKVMATLSFYLMIYIVVSLFHVSVYFFFKGKIKFDQFAEVGESIIWFLGIFSSGGMTAIAAQKILNKKKNEKSKDNSNNS